MKHGHDWQFDQQLHQPMANGQDQPRWRSWATVKDAQENVFNAVKNQFYSQDLCDKWWKVYC